MQKNANRKEEKKKRKVKKSRKTMKPYVRGVFQTQKKPPLKGALIFQGMITISIYGQAFALIKARTVQIHTDHFVGDAARVTKSYFVAGMRFAILFAQSEAHNSACFVFSGNTPFLIGHTFHVLN